MSSTQEQQNVVPNNSIQTSPLICFGTDEHIKPDVHGNQPIIVVMTQVQELTTPLIKLLFNKKQNEYIYQANNQPNEVLPHDFEIEAALNFFYQKVKFYKEQGVNINGLLFSPYAHLDYAHYKIINNDIESVSTVKLKDNKTTKYVFLNKKHPYSPHYSIH